MLRRAAAIAPEAGSREVVVREVRTPLDLRDLDGLIVPGGESTTIGKLLVAYGLEEPIRDAARDGLPVWGTCAGMILLARDIVGGEPDGRIGLMDLTVQRNAFGRQLDSFEVDLPFTAWIVRSTRCSSARRWWSGSVLRRRRWRHCLTDASSRRGRAICSPRHSIPELTPDTRLHALFIRSCQQSASSRQRAA